MSEFPDITILVPVWKRPEFLPLLIMNLKSQNYPHEHLRLLITTILKTLMNGSLKTYKKSNNYYIQLKLNILLENREEVSVRNVMI